MNKYSFQNEFWNFSTYQQEFYFHQGFGAKRGEEILSGGFWDVWTNIQDDAEQNSIYSERKLELGQVFLFLFLFVCLLFG